MNIICPCTQACHGERGEANGGRRADVLPTSYKSTDPGNAEKVQQREADHFQHLPVLPQGEAAVPSLELIVTTFIFLFCVNTVVTLHIIATNHTIWMEKLLSVKIIWRHQRWLLYFNVLEALDFPDYSGMFV